MRSLAKRLPETKLLATGLAMLILGMAGIGGLAWLLYRLPLVLPSFSRSLFLLNRLLFSLIVLFLGLF